MDPKDSGITRLIVGGENFAEESREYPDEVWGIPSYKYSHLLTKQPEIRDTH